MAGIFGFKKEEIKDKPPEGIISRGKDQEGREHYETVNPEYERAQQEALERDRIQETPQPQPEPKPEPVPTPTREVSPTQTEQKAPEKEGEDLTDREKAIYQAGLERGALAMQKAVMNAIMDLKP